MQKSGEQIIIGIVAGSIVLLMLGLFICLFLLYYQRRHNSYISEKLLMKRLYEENLIQTGIEVQEQTRQKLAIDLHDNIGQLLSLTNITLASVNLTVSDKAMQKIDDAQELVSRSIRELRRLSKVLHGEQLIKQGLIESIQQEVDWLISKGYYDIHFEYNANGKEFMREDLNLFIFRIFQESLNNILKHSEADTIDMRMEYVAPALHLSIADNGCGFENSSERPAHKGMGLSTMQKRAELMGGTMKLQSEKGKGTILQFKLPYL
jgi:two-component system, NarL family, sensor kinase